MSLHDHVSGDPNRRGIEKETGIQMLGTASEFRVNSAKPTIIKSLLQHDEFEFENAVLHNSDTEEDIYVDSRDAARDVTGDIIFIDGRMPIGCLTIKSSPRSNDHQSSIVNHEGVQEGAFE